MHRAPPSPQGTCHSCAINKHSSTQTMSARWPLRWLRMQRALNLPDTLQYAQLLHRKQKAQRTTHIGAQIPDTGLELIGCAGGFTRRSVKQCMVAGAAPGRTCASCPPGTSRGTPSPPPSTCRSPPCTPPASRRSSHRSPCWCPCMPTHARSAQPHVQKGLLSLWHGAWPAQRLLDRAFRRAAVVAQLA